MPTAVLSPCPSEPMATAAAYRIAALTGGSSPAIQDLLWNFVRDLSSQGRRIVGVIERHAPGMGRTSASVRLVNLVDGETYPVFQDLGPLATGCRMDPAGIVQACQGVLRTLDATIDLVVLSKFGKCERERSGLLDAFIAAVALDLPVITAVAPSADREWSAFADPFATYLRPDRADLDAWWRALDPHRPAGHDIFSAASAHR